VRKDLGYIALVTPTSQIVGTQAVLNVLAGERYKTITKETAGVLRGEYGSTPAPVDAELQARVLKDGEEPISCRPADNLSPEMERLTAELEALAMERSIELAPAVVDDVLIYALFPQIGLKFLENRRNPAAFEPTPWQQVVPPEAPAPSITPVAAPVAGPEAYRVEVNGLAYDVVVSPQGVVQAIAAATATPPAPAAPPANGGTPVPSPLAGNVVKVRVSPGQRIQSGDVILILEAMKMETEVRAPMGGRVVAVRVKEGGCVQVGDPLVMLA
jgi:oxaloacetate decarboxylase alpha subunit